MEIIEIIDDFYVDTTKNTNLHKENTNRCNIANKNNCPYWSIVGIKGRCSRGWCAV